MEGCVCGGDCGRSQSEVLERFCPGFVTLHPCPQGFGPQCHRGTFFLGPHCISLYPLLSTIQKTLATLDQRDERSDPIPQPRCLACANSSILLTASHPPSSFFTGWVLHLHSLCGCDSTILSQFAQLFVCPLCG